jgi:putative flippase GtrA
MNHRQLGMFLTVGLTSAAVNFFVFFSCWNVLAANYLIASSLAYVLAVVTHFLGNRNFTFKSGHVQLLPQLKRYMLMLSVNYVISMLVITACVERLRLSPYIGLMAAIGLTVGLGFIVSRQWVFKINEI